ncbi:Methionine adenosyltransferase 2 [Monocercomonoides exilis]|uniref:Methionine adenosyltransferase 2 n=1 Tax=Monocercomonoides exilis TaxID=2049356 RepID=UPI003559C3AA|nr:Methionine adenosyltransferase 2 [Monocercomonoides exilis]|eukprot:MONOS_8415.1-p1 / transcript=MONOS_8415.1 / gene=MONOS_8415 / organism=Monocercomonoides_exilis_PA203 / gene_product=Methionine adenosyltransferase 2 / transcript_product=Methionine adenosyltransferase 2 / location=Mono_scaffold00316:48551-49853(+) / protein_length=393 / sequence_SO=supercontig / SO=protein_coding / is_pseudo=false
MSTSDSELFYFTSESVSEGHPDKLCDLVSDAIVDECLRQDEHSRVACETACKGNWCVVFGEITSNANLNIPAIVKQVYKDVGYDDATFGADYKTLEVEVRISQQSSEIDGAVSNVAEADTGAGDQGLMFGFACNESEELVPLTLLFSHRLVEKLSQVRKSRVLPWLQPDAKSQVTFAYKMEKRVPVPQFADTIVISTQHTPDVSNEVIRQEVIDKVIKAVIPPQYLTEKTKIYVNPSGRFTYGGPKSDAGLTGRKIIVDTYGGWGGHGGGAFSGKDWTKVDRSGSYLARWIAKSLVASKVVDRCLIELSYVIGLAQPISLFIDDFGTSKIPTKELQALVKNNFDMRPGMIATQLDLKKPRFYKTAAYGHFGRTDPSFTWEVPKMLDFTVVKA